MKLGTAVRHDIKTDGCAQSWSSSVSILSVMNHLQYTMRMLSATGVQQKHKAFILDRT